MKKKFRGEKDVYLLNFQKLKKNQISNTNTHQAGHIHNSIIIRQVDLGQFFNVGDNY